MIPNAPVSSIDPTHLVRGLGTRIIIDAATPAYPDIPLADASPVDMPKEAPYWNDKIRSMMEGLRRA